MRSPEPPVCRWSFLGRLPYGRAEALQRRLRDRVRQQPGTAFLVLLEHPPVFSLGRNAKPGDVLADDTWLVQRGVEVVRTDRGGRVTYHGPGQLVGYPIIDLSPDRRDLRRYMRDLQEVLVRVLGDFGIAAAARHERDEIGVWVDRRKIASLGVHVSRWITTHGFALNVSTDLSYFAGIIPCGLEEVEMTSIAALGGPVLELADVAASCAGHFGGIFERRMVPVACEALLDPCPIAS